VKTLTTYQCELCNKIYKQKVKAIKCEAVGIEEPLAKVGDVVYRITKIMGSPDQYSKTRISKIEPFGHQLVYSFDDYYTGIPNVTNVFSNEGYVSLVTTSIE
jgi:hypothetical protein